MGEERGALEGGQCEGEGAGVPPTPELHQAKPEAAPAVSDVMVEDANSRRMHVDGKGGGDESEAGASSCDTIGALGEACSMGRNNDRIRADTCDDGQIESSLVSEFEAQNPAMGSSSHLDSEADVEEGYDHLFTDTMKIQLRAQILVLGDLLKGISPSPDWLEEACLEPGIGAEFGLFEALDAPREVPAELNHHRISSGFQDVEASLSPSAESADPPTATAAERPSHPGDPSSSGKDFLFIEDDLAQERGPSGQLMITYDQTTAAASNPNAAAQDISQATDTCVQQDNDKHLDLAQASAQDALTTATSALAQSHMVWARLHSQNHSEEGIARDARIASVAATVAAAASVAKAAVEAARAIAEVSVDAFIQAGGYQVGDTSLAQLGSTRSRPLQVAGLDQSLHGNNRENTSQHRSGMVESVVQAAGKAAEAATQAGVVLAKANPLIQMSGLSEFWSRKQNEGDPEHERNGYGGMNQGNGMNSTNQVDGLDGGRSGDALNGTHDVGEFHGGNEEDAIEEIEDIREDDISCQDILNVVTGMGDLDGGGVSHEDFVVEGDVVSPHREEGGRAAANEAEALVENGVGIVEAYGVEGVGVNEDEVIPVNEVAEPTEQEKSIVPRSRNVKRGRGRGRGRGRSQGASSRAKRLKNSVEASSDIQAAQTLGSEMQREDEPESRKNGTDANARIEERGVDDVETTTVSPSGKSIPDTGLVEPSGENTSASAAAQIPENEVQGMDDVPEIPKTGRGGNRRGEPGGAKQMEKTPAITSREDAAPAVPAQASGEEGQSLAAAHNKENGMQNEEDVSKSPKTVRGANGRGKRRGMKPMGRTPVSAFGKDTPLTAPASPAAATPEDEMQRNGDVPESAKTVRESTKTVRGGSRRGRKRGWKLVGNTSLRTSRKVTPLTAPAPPGEARPASAAAQTPEIGMHRKDDVPEIANNVRGGSGSGRGKKRGAKQVENTPVSTPASDVLPAAPAQLSEEERPVSAAAQIPETQMQGADHVPESRKSFRGGYRRGRKRGAKTPVSSFRKAVLPAATDHASGEERQSPAAAHILENEMQTENDVPKAPENVSGGKRRGRKRGAKQMETASVSTSGKDIAERGSRDPEIDRNTNDIPEHAMEGADVEVMTDEVGLRGGWFSGTVLRTTPNEAFVELQDLLTDDGKSKVREWFPVVEGFSPYRPRRHVRPVHPFSIFTEAGSRKRRRVALGSQTWHVGDHVDAFFQDAWWEGIVAELNDLDPSKATIYFPEENDTQVVKTWDLRPSFQWKDNKWMPWKNPVLVEDERPQKRHKTSGDVNKSGGTKSGPDDSIAQKSNGKSRKGKAKAAETAEDSTVMPEPISAAGKKSPVKMADESILSQKRSGRSKVSFKRLKTSEKEDASPSKHDGRSTITKRKAQQKDVLSPGTSKKLDFTLDSTASASTVNPARSKPSITRAKPRHWKKKVPS